jgi:hypothetical protein
LECDEPGELWEELADEDVHVHRSRAVRRISCDLGVNPILETPRHAMRFELVRRDGHDEELAARHVRREHERMLERDRARFGAGDRDDDAQRAQRHDTRHLARTW